MTATSPAPDGQAALDIATALLRLVGAGTSEAAHLASAISRHRREMRREGAAVPATLDELERVFARVAVGSRKVTGGHSGSAFDEHQTADQGGLHDTDLLDRAQAAQRLRCSESTLKRREASGALPVVRHGRVVRYRVADLDAYLQGEDRC